MHQASNPTLMQSPPVQEPKVAQVRLIKQLARPFLPVTDALELQTSKVTSYESGAKPSLAVNGKNAAI